MRQLLHSASVDIHLVPYKRERKRERDREKETETDRDRDRDRQRETERGEREGEREYVLVSQWEAFIHPTFTISKILIVIFYWNKTLSFWDKTQTSSWKFLWLHYSLLF